MLINETETMGLPTARSQSLFPGLGAGREKISESDLDLKPGTREKNLRTRLSVYILL